MVRMLGWAVRAWALVQVLVAAVWVVGPYGTGVLGGRVLPDWLLRVFGPLLDGVFTGPFVGASLANPAVVRRIDNLSTHLAGTQGGPFRGAFGDIDLGWRVQFSILTRAQSVEWTVLHVVPLLAMAVLWWTLAGVLFRARGGSVFTARNATLLTWAGVVVLLGAPLVSALRWWMAASVAHSSQIANQIKVLGYSWDQVPWSAVAAGIALVVLGRAWRRGVVMENDLGGLV